MLRATILYFILRNHFVDKIPVFLDLIFFHSFIFFLALKHYIYKEMWFLHSFSIHFKNIYETQTSKKLKHLNTNDKCQLFVKI